MKLTNDEINAIKTDAADNWNDDLQKAIAAHLYGFWRVRRNGVLAFADTGQIAEIENQITSQDAVEQTPPPSAPNASAPPPQQPATTEAAPAGAPASSQAPATTTAQPATTEAAPAQTASSEQKSSNNPTT